MIVVIQFTRFETKLVSQYSDLGILQPFSEVYGVIIFFRRNKNDFKGKKDRDYQSLW